MAFSVAPDGAAKRGIGVTDLLHLIRHPRRGWVRMKAAPVEAGALLVGTALPLAVIRPMARLIHDLVYGRSSMGIIQYRPTPVGAVVTALAAWALTMAALVLLALAIATLAPRFGGSRDRAAALKVAIAGAAPFFLASLFLLVPPLEFLQLLGLYGLVLIVVGAAPMMHVPRERAGRFGAIIAAIALVLVAIQLVVVGAIADRWLEPTVKTAGRRVVVTQNASVAGVTLVAPANTKKAAVAPGAGAGGTVVPASSLQTLLPAQIGGFLRTSVASQSSVSLGAATADAKGTYVAGTNSFTLTITDSGQPGALATNDSVIAGEINRVSDAGYQRSQVVNGVRITEKWSNADHGGSFSRTVASRFTVEAQGTAPAIETLRAAVNAVDRGRLSLFGQ